MGPEWTPFRAVRKDFTKGKALKTFKLRRSIQNLCVSGPGMRKRCWGQMGVSKWELIGSFVTLRSNCKGGILRAYCVSCPVPWTLSILLQGTDAPLEFKCYLSKLKNLDTANVVGQMCDCSPWSCDTWRPRGLRGGVVGTGQSAILCLIQGQGEVIL